MTFDPDHGHGHAHAHGTGLKWLDIVVAVSVVFISVLSLWVSIEHGRIMERMANQNEKMVAGSTLPLLEFGSSDFDPKSNTRHSSLFVKNGGVGPAVIVWLEMRYHGVAYGDLASLLHACCVSGTTAKTHGRANGVYYGNISNTVLPARETAELIGMTDSAPPDLYTAFDGRGRAGLSAKACYCSVLDACWITDFGRSRPTPVKSCAAPPDLKPW